LYKYGKDAWIAHNDFLSHSKELLDRELESQKIEVNEINLARKREHTSAGQKLSRLEARVWTLSAQSDALENEIKRRKL
jgi:hypothetical protein